LHLFTLNDTLGRTPLDETSASHRDLYLITHKTHKRHTSMPPRGFEPGVLASELPQTHTLYRAAIHIAFDEHKNMVFTDILQTARTVIGAQIYHVCNALCSEYICQHFRVYVMNYEQNM
jgi:hypothetical protein